MPIILDNNSDAFAIHVVTEKGPRAGEAELAGGFWRTRKRDTWPNDVVASCHPWEDRHNLLVRQKFRPKHPTSFVGGPGKGTHQCCRQISYVAGCGPSTNGPVDFLARRARVQET